MNAGKLPIGKIKSAKDVAQIVVRRRKAQQLTQLDLAGLGQTGNRFIVDLESGKGSIQFDKALHILDMLGLDVVVMEREK